MHGYNTSSIPIAYTWANIIWERKETPFGTKAEIEGKSSFVK